MVQPRLGENNTRLTDHPDYNKNYMREYYRKNLSKDKVQIICSLCCTVCTVQKIKRHQTTALCKRRADRLDENKLNEAIKEFELSIKDSFIDENASKEFMKEFTQDLRDKFNNSRAIV